MLIIILFILHFVLVNPSEKLFTQAMFGNLLRPGCQNTSFKCLGMPSGHAEVAVLVFGMLYMLGYLPFVLSCVIILAICIQRVWAKRHTVAQVIVGALLGLLYACIYLTVGGNWRAIVLCLMVIVALNLFITMLISKEIYKAPPAWVDPKLYYIIDRKRQIYSLPLKMLINYAVLVTPAQLFLSWHDLEKKCDRIISQLQGQHFDCVIGIKSGGAIVSNYIASKLKLKNYYIKVSRKCEPKSYDFLISMGNRLRNEITEIIVCEPINENITNMRVLLVDESIGTGSSMQAARDYLYSKGAADVTIATLANWRLSKHDFQVVCPDEVVYHIYPWGYDN